MSAGKISEQEVKEKQYFDRVGFTYKRKNIAITCLPDPDFPFMLL
jgi:hypothetical protein